MDKVGRKYCRPIPSEIAYSNPDLSDLASQHGRMVELAIMHGDRERALDVVMRAFDLLSDKQVATSSMPLEAILPLKIASILSKSGVVTVGDACRLGSSRLLEIKNINDSSLLTIREILLSHGWELKN